MDRAAELFRLESEQLEIIKSMIRDELAERIPALEEAEAKAAEEYRAALAEAESPQKALADIDAEIEDCRGVLRDWEVSFHSRVLDERIAARGQLGHWNAELSDLEDRRAKAEAELQPCEEKIRTARAKLAAAENDRKLMEFNLSTPFAGFGQKTSAYQYRALFGNLLTQVLLTEEAGLSVEWNKATELMDTICLTSGYRTDHLTEDAARMADLQKARFDEFTSRARDNSVSPASFEAGASAVVQNNLGDPQRVSHANEKLRTLPDDYYSTHLRGR